MGRAHDASEGHPRRGDSPRSRFARIGEQSGRDAIALAAGRRRCGYGCTNVISHCVALVGRLDTLPRCRHGESDANGDTTPSRHDGGPDGCPHRCSDGRAHAHTYSNSSAAVRSHDHGIAVRSGGGTDERGRELLRAGAPAQRQVQRSAGAGTDQDSGRGRERLMELHEGFNHDARDWHAHRHLHLAGSDEERIRAIHGAVAAGERMDFNPLLAVGLVFSRGDEGRVLGSCFAFRDRGHFLTAHHCIREVQPSNLGILLPRHNERYLRVADIQLHPSADLAVLRTDDHEPPEVAPFWNTVTNWALGEEFFAYGYPADPLGPIPMAPTSRLFKGHYQRFFDHISFMGFRYLAGEMSIAAPAGLSGGPLFRPRAPRVVTALATENMSSELVVGSVEETTVSGTPSRTVIRQNVVSYGVAVMLSEVADWLDANVPGKTVGR